MNFVHIADLHIGQSFKSASFGREFGRIKRQAIKENLNKIIDYCNLHQIDFLLMAGDCIEADYTQVSDLLDLKYMFEKLIKTRIIMIAGNHDPAIIIHGSMESIQWPEHVYIINHSYEYIEFEDKNIGFFCASWQNKKNIQFDYELMDRTLETAKVKQHIGILHGDIYSAQGYMPLDKNRLLNSKLDYIALGHIHKPDIIQGKLAYPGSLEPLDFSEKGSHGFILGELNGKKIHLEHIEQMLHPMKTSHLDVSRFESGMEIIDEIKARLQHFEKKDMLRLILTGEMRLAFELLESLVDGNWNTIATPCVSYLEVIDNTKDALDIKQIYEEHKEDIIGHYIEVLQEQDLKDKAYKDALVLGIKMLLNEAN